MTLPTLSLLYRKMKRTHLMRKRSAIEGAPAKLRENTFVLLKNAKNPMELRAPCFSI
jgi:hypothetical protein